MKLSQLEKRIQQTLTNSKDIIQNGRKSSRWSGLARSTRGQANDAWAMYLSRDRYIARPKLAFPDGYTFARGLLFTWANQNKIDFWQVLWQTNESNTPSRQRLLIPPKRDFQTSVTIIMTNIYHTEKAIKFNSDKKDANLRTVHRMRSTKLLTHLEMSVGTIGHDRKLREVWYLIIYIKMSLKIKILHVNENLFP